MGASCSPGVLHWIPSRDKQLVSDRFRIPFFHRAGTRDLRLGLRLYLGLHRQPTMRHTVAEELGEVERLGAPAAGGRVRDPKGDSKPHRDGRQLGESRAGLTLQRREACVYWGACACVQACVLGRGTMKAVAVEAPG